MVDFERMNELQNTMHDIARREARQRRTVAEAAERQLTQASDAVNDIVAEIEFFESSLDPNEEARLVIIGGPVGAAIFPTAMSSLGIDRIRFEGTDNEGNRVSVMQHISQLNIMLRAVNVGKEEARRIGFHIDAT